MSNALARSSDLLSGLSAGDQPSRLLRIYAALAGAVVAYPWLLAGFYSSGRRAVSGDSEAIFGWVGVVVFLTTVFAVPAFAFLVAITNNNAPGTAASPEETAARRAAHLAVAAPPLFTLTGVVLAIFNIPGLGILPWTLGWIAIFGTLSFLHRHGASTSFIAPASSPALRVAHGISAAFIIVFFLALHLANHLVGLWTPDAHKAVMNALRSWYRASWFQPLLVLAEAEVQHQFQVRSSARACRACSRCSGSAASAGGDGGRKSPELLTAQSAYVACGRQPTAEQSRFMSRRPNTESLKL